MTPRYSPRRSWYRRRPVVPPPARVYEEIVEDFGPDPYPPGAPLEPAPWARSVWFWLLLLGIVVVVGVLILLAAESR